MKFSRNSFPLFLFSFFGLLSFEIQHVVAQTTTIIYSEDFNSGSNGWITGGYNSSWSHGIPSLPNIVSNGTKCFVTGDAGAATSEPYTSCLPFPGPNPTGNFYNCCERSFVESPVIDLTGVNFPMLSLDINVYCEQTFDGAKVQISTNGGTNWSDVGVYTSSTYQTFPSSKNCREQNWFNKNFINHLSHPSGGCGMVNYIFGGANSGWSGGCAQASSGACTANDSHGTNGWVTATHCLTNAANKSNVKIRVVFGGGSQVYSDGFGFDNVTISDVYPVVSFTEAIVAGCEPELSFTNTTDCAKTYVWDFGNAGFPGNNSSATNPTHVFSAPGNYNVTLTATDYCGGTISLIKTVNVTAGNGPIISSVTATGSGLCNSAVDSILINLNPSNTGLGPYEVTWLVEGNSFSALGLTGNPIILSGLMPGMYEQITVEDANGCVNSFPNSVSIPLIVDGITVDAGPNMGIHIGDTIQLNAVSNLASTFSWQPVSTLNDPAIASPVAMPETTTVYSIVVTSLNGCTATDNVTIVVRDENPCNRFFLPNSFTPNGDGRNEKFVFLYDASMRIEEFNMMIFNRWGELVFDANDPVEGWDGSEAPVGIYAFIVQVTCTNKKNSYVSGTISLVR